jgi:hypothetical protein
VQPAVLELRALAAAALGLGLAQKQVKPIERRRM